MNKITIEGGGYELTVHNYGELRIINDEHPLLDESELLYRALKMVRNEIQGGMVDLLALVLYSAMEDEDKSADNEQAANQAVLREALRNHIEHAGRLRASANDEYLASELEVDGDEKETP